MSTLHDLTVKFYNQALYEAIPVKQWARHCDMDTRRREIVTPSGTLVMRFYHPRNDLKIGAIESKVKGKFSYTAFYKLNGWQWVKAPVIEFTDHSVYIIDHLNIDFKNDKELDDFFIQLVMYKS